MKIIVRLMIGTGIILMLFSCHHAKQITYLQGPFDTAKLSQVKIPEPLIQKGDLLSIVVYSDNAAASALYNQPVASAASTTGTQADAAGSAGMPQSGSAGYLVDEDGNIQFQGIGRMQVAGLTKAQLTHLLDSKLKDSVLFHPYYNIRFLNYKVTLLGDVTKPGVYSVPTERISILDAIGLAGDVTIYGKLDDVRVIREVNGVREFGMLDLSKPESINSPFYYLKQNDMIIVGAVRKKTTAADQATVRDITIVTSIVSAVGIIISILTRF